jgi:hypothetical protein
MAARKADRRPGRRGPGLADRDRGLGYHLGPAGSRQPVLTALLALMWTGGIVMTVDLNRPRFGAIRIEAAPLERAIKGMAQQRRADAPGANSVQWEQNTGSDPLCTKR